MHRRVRSRFAAPVLSLGWACLLAACSGEGAPGEDGAAAPSEATLVAVIAGADDFSVVAATLEDAGLAQVFDGVAAYTLLAPRDAVFADLGAAGETLRSPEQRPAMVAVLRDHIVPGFLTPRDIATAVELESDGKVEMRTMAGHTLTFSSNDGTITATGESGATIRFTGDALLARNGVAIPVDGLLVDVSEAQVPE